MEGWYRPWGCSSHKADFLGSVCRVPEVVLRIVFGGMWRRPGPRVRVPFFVGAGRRDEGIISPGRRTVDAIAVMDEGG
jgi:hypothetical protein